MNVWWSVWSYALLRPTITCQLVIINLINLDKMAQVSQVLVCPCPLPRGMGHSRWHCARGVFCQTSDGGPAASLADGCQWDSAKLEVCQQMLGEVSPWKAMQGSFYIYIYKTIRFLPYASEFQNCQLPVQMKLLLFVEFVALIGLGNWDYKVMPPCGSEDCSAMAHAYGAQRLRAGKMMRTWLSRKRPETEQFFLILLKSFQW